MRPVDRIRIAAVGTISEGAVRRAYLGQRVTDQTHIRVARAAAELALPPPPPPARSSREGEATTATRARRA